MSNDAFFSASRFMTHTLGGLGERQRVASPIKISGYVSDMQTVKS